MYSKFNKLIIKLNQIYFATTYRYTYIFLWKAFVTFFLRNNSPFIYFLQQMNFFTLKNNLV